MSRASTDLDGQARLAKIAKVLEKTDWTGATHGLSTTDDGLFGVGTEVYVVERLARPNEAVVFLHRTWRKAIERRLIKRTRDGWLVWTINGPAKKQQVNRKTWCGGYRAVASMMPAAALARARA